MRRSPYAFLILRLLFVPTISVAVFPAPARAQAQKTSECAPIDENDQLRVLHSVERIFHTEPVLPVIDHARFVADTCVWQFSISVPNSDRHWVLYLSPDRKFLFGTLLNISVDPEEADKELSAQLNREAETDHAPVRGPETAPVTVTVFSDFQCPYCAEFSQRVERYRKDHLDKIRVIFRNLPLPVHDWAMSAARAGSCIAGQSPSSFWTFHDLLFSEQKNITTGTLPATVADFIASSPDLQSDAYSKCVGSTIAQSLLDRDLAEAKSLNIEATPTIFVNGRRYNGFGDDAALAFAISLAIRAEQSKADTAPSAKN